jgi:hypothetical protein
MGGPDAVVSASFCQSQVRVSVKEVSAGPQPVDVAITTIEQESQSDLDMTVLPGRAARRRP